MQRHAGCNHTWDLLLGFSPLVFASERRYRRNGARYLDRRQNYRPIPRAVAIGGVTAVEKVGSISLSARPVARIPGEDAVCDYSLHAVESRPAKVGETLVT